MTTAEIILSIMCVVTGLTGVCMSYVNISLDKQLTEAKERTYKDENALLKELVDVYQYYSRMQRLTRGNSSYIPFELKFPEIEKLMEAIVSNKFKDNE